MFLKILRSVAIGLIVAGILLVSLPSLRQKIAPLAPSKFDSADETPLSYNIAVRRAAPAVVNVYNRSVGSNAQNQLEIKTLGSGVIMDDRGYIITNKHVINNAEQIIVALQDGRVFEALLVGSDNLTDLAVLKINATGLPIIPINSKRLPHIGDVVMAIGNPYNLGQTITQGIISATGRIGLSPSGRQSFLQTDASINHGNSGGALVNSLGELMGINTLSFDKSNDGETPEGIGFAIPTQLATKIMDKLIRDGRVIRGYIGIGGREITPLHGPATGIDQIQGIIVNEVSPDGPAAKAGIQVNDVIVSVNHKPAISALETMDQVAEIRPGSVIPVEVMREDKKLTMQVTIQEYPAGN
ncbi:outer membrane-stress sensor serine endopeptidase DegS [Enterobacteriaceae bacterium H20N1]|uniref:Serine endoprotease DegS n=1 Tax=Dryocola boscaweniae TaxID=2925397 RepID=A0A9X3ACL7_9ENTR|nr:outer membrane-stress sensor serine endopeptidase DegS [Dryocola boscaweniae]MCT4702018.1 outer membrane-stress sensor serine endopeptidase DegS [Dryocola boscaweniae]MCT4714696.1 outer membrane-stress sensor serine endopeptidase DegS [Dryocola boscaweniae]MCT4719186.1 outer membrane-stress sensor serine endopeptidase DegS [Dryocola boscaweniae]